MKCIYSNLKIITQIYCVIIYIYLQLVQLIKLSKLDYFCEYYNNYYYLTHGHKTSTFTEPTQRHLLAADRRHQSGDGAARSTRPLPRRVDALPGGAVLPAQSAAEVRGGASGQDVGGRTDHRCHWRRCERCVDDPGGARRFGHCGQGGPTGGAVRRLCVRQLCDAEAGAAGARLLLLASAVGAGAVLLLQELGVYADSGE